MIDPSYEHYIVYNMIEGRRTGRGSGPAGTSKGFWLDNGEAILVLPAEAVQGDLALYITDVRTALWERVSAQYAAVMTAGCASPKGWVDCDDKAQMRVANTVLLLDKAVAAGMTPPPVRWTMFDKTKVEHSRAELDALGLAIGFHAAAVFAVKQYLEDAIGAAADVPALLQIDVSAGWPG